MSKLEETNFILDDISARNNDIDEVEVEQQKISLLMDIAKFLAILVDHFKAEEE